MKKAFGILLLIFTGLFAAGQNGDIEENAKQFSHPEFRKESDYDREYNIQLLAKRNSGCFLNREVYGIHPAWSGTAWKSYDFSLLSTVAYLGYEIDPETGGPRTLHQWGNSGLPAAAREGNSLSELAVYCSESSDISKFLNNSTAVSGFFDSITTTLKKRNSEGICVLFDKTDPKNAEKYVQFLKLARESLDNWNNKASLTVLIPEIPWTAEQKSTLNAVCDRFIVQSPSGNFPERQRSLLWVPLYSHFIRPGMNGPVIRLNERDKIRGVPLWRDSTDLRQKGADGDKSGYKEASIQDSLSLKHRFRMVTDSGYAGVALFGLGYDHGLEYSWDLLKENFADCNTGIFAVEETMPGSEGITSAERNKYHWVYMLIGMVLTIFIMWGARKLMKSGEN